MTEPTRLTDMEFDEVSLVGIPANQHADILLFKSSTKPETLSTITRRSRAGQMALARHRIVKAMEPSAQDVHEEETMGNKKAYKKKAKKKKTPKADPIIEVSEEK